MPEQDLPLQVFRDLITVISTSSLIDLNGWGEPLLHPHLKDMVLLLKSRKCFTGFSTNGLMLSPQKAAELLNAGLDYLAFSLDGATGQTYQSVRGAKFETVIRNIENMVRIRAGNYSPQLSITFVMLKTNLDEVLEMVRLAARLGVDFIRLKKVDVFTQADYDQLTYDYDDPYNPQAALTEQQTETIKEAVRLGETLGIGVQVPRVKDSGLPFCWMEPEHTVFINSAGAIAPCCILGHSSIRFSPNKTSRRYSPFSFGSVRQDQPWFSGDQYREFHRAVQQHQILECCAMCPKITPDREGI